MLGVAAAAAPASASTGPEPLPTSAPGQEPSQTAITDPNSDDENGDAVEEDPYSFLGSSPLGSCALNVAEVFLETKEPTRYLKLVGVIDSVIGEEGVWTDVVNHRSLAVIIWHVLPTSCIDFAISSRFHPNFRGL